MRSLHVLMVRKMLLAHNISTPICTTVSGVYTSKIAGSIGVGGALSRDSGSVGAVISWNYVFAG